ncbi:MAG: hypothetical protein AB1726_13175, partial [Planctomycetota bacterium]
LGGLALVAGTLGALVRDELPPFAYALFVLALAALLLAIPLLGELGILLREEEAAEWISAQPVRPAARWVARTAHLLLALWALALAVLLPAAALAPAATSVAGRLLLPLAGLGLATLLAAVLLLVQGLLGGRGEGLLVLLQTALVGGVFVGGVRGLGAVPALATLADPNQGGAEWLAVFPPAWFAAPLAPGAVPAAAWFLPVGLTLAALVLLLLAPAPAPLARGRREPLLARLLSPARALATRFWVRPGERAFFDLVYDALPREREFVLRTYPMVGIPLAFLAAGALGETEGPGAARADLLALLLFSAGIYLPVLLTQIPISASHTARWLHECAPVDERDVAGGAIKALAVRFLVPLYAVLAAIAVLLGSGGLALRLAPSGALTSLLVLRLLYPVCVSDRPLSVDPAAARTNPDWLGALAGVGLALALLAIVAHRFLAGPLATAGLLAALLALEAWLARRARAPEQAGGRASW